MTKGRDTKPHIGIFGRRNNGKSTFINSLVGQEIAIVSEHAGTTTDPVKKSIEIFGIGPAIIIDTAGIDDFGKLGEKRIEKTLDVINIIDCAILLITENHFGDFELGLIKKFKELDIPFVIVHNKSDIQKLTPETESKITKQFKCKVIDHNSKDTKNIENIINEIKNIIPENAYQKTSLIGNLVEKDDIVLLITPIDSEAPEGRMILPQVMALRDILDNDCIAIVVKETEVEAFLNKIAIKPKLVITDSQVFDFVKNIIPEEIALTSFSIILARMRGNFENYISGTRKISELKEGDKVLILESCTHQISCDDIGRVKIPNWLNKFTNKKIDFDVVSGLNKINGNIKDYSLVIQCGGCVITKKQLQSRLKPAIDAGVPVTNYGMAIAYMHGTFERSVGMFKK
ncbi:MAG: [FeFe] hydrogenase H-cluster maturation GTPase HydF [Bacteroidales bacterium]|nr:[FeFe] hydrogenase H-cluster maturation GTPase HydF [Bacteroidales bacterium]